jgi:hypothetical protein
MASVALIQLVTAVVNILVPQILAIVKAHEATHGVTPTASQVIDQLSAQETLTLAQGQAWTQAHPSGA